MSPTLSVAARLSPAIRQDIGIQVLARTEPISHLAATHQVSRKFIYQQGDKAQRSLDESFAPTPADDEVLFHLPVTKSWLYQLILGLVLICHSSYRGVVELFRDLFDTPISIGTVHNRLEAAAATAVEMNQMGRFSHDVLALAGPSLAVRQELFDFIVRELKQREDEQYPAIRKLRKALRNQRDQLLAFAGVVDQKLAKIAVRFELPLQAVRDVCLLHRKHDTSDAYWVRWNQLHSQLSGQFHGVMEAVEKALKETPRASSMVENLNSRLRNYFFLRRSLGDDYLNLLQFFLNHRQFMRSLKPERVGKSPTQLLTGEAHSHWLELLGFKRFQRA
ncbi:hypothetical protein [Leptothoe sp. PORK10 BA2]|uniref:hypothetical protein n=1 Tax=Leptothoe sp. PORK10 BA2 TaxID=3110254 RepID=UPI002B210F99|nr:hypothetical protein [Leptothoe sp. PORK10 BA2]MEA5464974.1 hypothetical protein [Leptothoe sp. PORK10 BA2]